MQKEYNRRQKWAVFFLDIVILFELTVSLYWANQFGDELTKMFLFTYLPVVVVTLIIGKRCINRLGATAEDDGRQDILEPVKHTHLIETLIEKKLMGKIK